ncbi:MAG: leucine-rich repeat domain-containing protein, partial [Bacteroidales bacterium]|nr:leucine-rich repeat domain-containing protein [Bacteroidales bacterium]
MRNKLLISTLLMVLSATVSVAQTTPLFSAVSPSGHRINYQWNYDDSYYRNGYPEYNSVMVWQSNYVMFDTQRYRSGDTTLHGAVVIPDSVTYGNKTYAVTRIHSFMAPYITDITIPNTVTKIDEDALSNCGFSTLTIPENVTSFGGGIAMDCDSLTTVYYNAKHASLPSGYGGRLFSWTVRNIVFGESVEEIPHHICKSQDSLRTVTILGNVKKIGEYAFAYCRKLKSVTIPASVEQIGTYAFVSCSNLDTVYYNATYCTTRYRDIWEDPFYLTNIKQLVIGENVQQIHLYMFDTVQTAICKAQVAPIVDNLVNNSRGFLTVVNGGKLFTGTGTQVIVPCGHTESYQSISEWSRNTISDDCVTVDTKSNDANLGIAVGGQICSPYTPLTLYALPFAGNTFVGWTDGNTDNPRDVISLTENVSFTAIFSTKDTVTLHDTTIIVDTLTEYVPVHDTTYIDVHDTTYVDVPYAVHDTTIVVDILTLTEYVPVHDT